MPKFIIPTKFVFSGEFTVEADSEQEARKIVGRDCGLCLGGDIHSSDSSVDWDFDSHPEKIVQGNVIQIKVNEKDIENTQGGGGLEIHIEGTEANPAESESIPVFIERYEGEIRVCVWNGEQDPAITTLKEKANES